MAPTVYEHSAPRFGLSVICNEPVRTTGKDGIINGQPFVEIESSIKTTMVIHPSTSTHNLLPVIDLTNALNEDKEAVFQLPYVHKHDPEHGLKGMQLHGESLRRLPARSNVVGLQKRSNQSQNCSAD